MDLARISLSGARYRLGSSSCPVVDHSDDPTGLLSIRLDRRRIQREQARSVWIRPGRRGAPGYRSGDRAPRRLRPSRLKSAVQGWVGRQRPAWSWVRYWWMFRCRLSSGPLPQCSHATCRTCGSPQHRAVRTSGVHQPRHLSTCPDRGVRRPRRLSWSTAQTSGHGARRAPTPCWDGHCGRPGLCGGQPHSTADTRPCGCPAVCGPDTPASAVRCCSRTTAECPGTPRPGPATHRVPRASGQGLRCGPRAPSDLRLCSHHRIINGGRPGLLTQARTPRTAR